MDMIKAEPHVHIVDTWPHGLTQRHRTAYKLCIDAGLIRILTVRADKVSRFTVIEYLSTIPEDWIHSTLRDCFNEQYEKFMQTADSMAQMRMEI